MCVKNYVILHLERVYVSCSCIQTFAFKRTQLVYVTNRNKNPKKNLIILILLIIIMMMMIIMMMIIIMIIIIIIKMIIIIIDAFLLLIYHYMGWESPLYYSILVAQKQE